MTTFQDAARVEVVKDALSSLSRDGKEAIFQELNEQLGKRDPASFSATTLKELLAVFPKVPGKEPSQPVTKAAFEEIYAGKDSKLEVRPHELGKEVRVTVFPGSVHAALEEAQAVSLTKHDIEPVYRGSLYNDPGMNDKLTEPLVISFVPVAHGSEQKDVFGSDPATSQEAFVREHGIGWVPRAIRTLAAAQYRAAMGLKPGVSPGSGEDNGDLFEGYLSSGPDGNVGTDSNMRITSYGTGGETSHLYAAVRTTGA